MRSLLLGLPLLLAAATRPPAAPACGDAALAALPDPWDASTAVSGDFDLDGRNDVAFWRADSASVILLIATCDGERLVRTWRIRVPLAGDCPPGDAVVQAASLLLDAELLERACGPGEADQCEHIRQENRRRQALDDAGGRALLIRGPRCAATRLRWSSELGGFMRLGA